jgi:hypothetical protein
MSAAASPASCTSRRHALTEDLLQLHDARVGADAVDGLRLPGIHALLEDLAVSGIGIVFVGHVN